MNVTNAGGVLEIVLISLAVLVVVGVTLFFLVRAKPEIAAPFARFLMRSKRVQRASQKHLAKELSENPDLLKEAAGEHLSNSQLKQVQKALGGRSKEETEELVGTLLQKAQDGERITQQDLVRTRPRTQDEARAKAKKKQKARAKRKQARKHRRK